MLLAGALVFGAFVGATFIIIHEVIKPLDITLSQRNIYIVVGIIISSIAIWIYSIKNKNKYYWELNENSLVRGNKNKVQFNLEDIEKLIIGIPGWGGLAGKLSKVANPHVAANLESAFQSSLIIKMKDNTFIPFNIHMVQHGTELMNALLDRFQDKIDENYEFSKKEKRLLTSPNWNSVTTI